MKTVSTGLGLCVLGVGVALYPVLDHLVPRADAGAPRGAGVIVAAATAQVEPTVVWYSVINNDYVFSSLWRAWSDGKVEMCRVRASSSADGSWCSPGYDPCKSPWYVISNPAQGLTYRSDINFDSKVDGADLGTLLADWGDAPRHDITPSDCPLNLINP